MTPFGEVIQDNNMNRRKGFDYPTPTWCNEHTLCTPPNVLTDSICRVTKCVVVVLECVVVTTECVLVTPECVR